MKISYLRPYGVQRYVLAPVSLVVKVEGGHLSELVRLGVHVAQVLEEASFVIPVLSKPRPIAIGNGRIWPRVQVCGIEPRKEFVGRLEECHQRCKSPASLPIV